jgi:hypothetical protein
MCTTLDNQVPVLHQAHLEATKRQLLSQSPELGALLAADAVALTKERSAVNHTEREFRRIKAAFERLQACSTTLRCGTAVAQQWQDTVYSCC